MAHDMFEHPHYKLLPQPPTPEDELCRCPGVPPLILFDGLGPNPVHCGHCKGEVLPERVGWSQAEVDDIASWLGLEHAITILWLNSGEYEAWAKRESESIDSAVNRQGRSLCARLSSGRECFLLYSRWDEAGGEVRIYDCPVCKKKLIPLESHARKHPLINVCRKCRIAAWHESFHRY